MLAGFKSAVIAQRVAFRGRCSKGASHAAGATPAALHATTTKGRACKGVERLQPMIRQGRTLPSGRRRCSVAQPCNRMDHFSTCLAPLKSSAPWVLLGRHRSMEQWKTTLGMRAAACLTSRTHSSSDPHQPYALILILTSRTHTS